MKSVRGPWKILSECSEIVIFLWKLVPRRAKLNSAGRPFHFGGARALERNSATLFRSPEWIQAIWIQKVWKWGQNEDLSISKIRGSVWQKSSGRNSMKFRFSESIQACWIDGKPYRNRCFCVLGGAGLQLVSAVQIVWIAKRGHAAANFVNWQVLILSSFSDFLNPDRIQIAWIHSGDLHKLTEFRFHRS